MRLALAYAPAAARPALVALFALDERLAGLVAAGREPSIARIRLAWWREALERLDSHAAPAEPLLAEIAGTLLPAGVRGAELAGMTMGWDALLPPEEAGARELAIHGRERGERLFALAGRLLGSVPPEGAGAVWAAAALRRAGLVATARPPAMRPGRWPRPLRPLGMLARLAERDIAAAILPRQGSPGRMMAMIRHRFSGR